MTDALPARPNFDWLRKTAKQHLRTMRLQRPEAKLAEAQFAMRDNTASRAGAA